MSKQGMFRRIVDTARKAMGMPVTHHYPDPESYVKPAGTGRRKFVRKAKPKSRIPCDPGTITYHDKLVKHFGARKALGYRYAIQSGYQCLPTEQDLADNPPWAFLK